MKDTHRRPTLLISCCPTSETLLTKDADGIVAVPSPVKAPAVFPQWQRHADDFRTQIISDIHRRLVSPEHSPYLWMQFIGTPVLAGDRTKRWVLTYQFSEIPLGCLRLAKSVYPDLSREEFVYARGGRLLFHPQRVGKVLLFNESPEDIYRFLLGDESLIHLYVDGIPHFHKVPIETLWSVCSTGQISTGG